MVRILIYTRYKIVLVYAHERHVSMPRRTLPGTNRCGASAIGVAVLVRDFAVLV